MGQLGCGLHGGLRQWCSICMEAVTSTRQAAELLMCGSGTGGGGWKPAGLNLSRQPALHQTLGAASASSQTRIASLRTMTHAHPCHTSSQERSAA